MPLPSFIATGNLKEILGDVAGSELVETAMTRARVGFTANLPGDNFILWDGTLERLESPIVGYVDTDGNLTLENGDPVRLLANDPGLTFTDLQWRVDIDLPASAIPPLPSVQMRSWWIDAAADGESVDLGNTAPVPGTTINGVAGLTAAGLLSILGDDTSSVRGALDALYGAGGGGGGSFDLPAAIHAATGKTTPVDADELALVDSAASNGLKKLTIGNLKTLIQTLVNAGVSSVVAGAPGALDTLNELAAAFGDDANFATTMTTALSNKQPVDATLTALAAITTAANKLIYATGSDTFATTDLTAAGRALLDDADAAAQRTTLSLNNVDNVADTAKPVSTAQQAAIDTQGVTDAVPLLRKQLLPPTRFPTGSKMLTAFQSGHGWTKFSSGTGSTGTAADDTSVFSEGSQSYKVTTLSTSGITIVQSPVFSPTLDLSTNSLVLKFRADLWARVSGISLLCSSDASGNMTTTRGVVTVGVGVSGYADDGEFVWVSVNPGDWATAGGFSAPAYTAITKVGVMVANTSAGVLSVNAQQVWTRPAPVATGTIITFDDGYLSQYTAAKPYMDKYGFKGVSFPIRDTIITGAGIGNYMGTTELQALYDTGWDISAHADLVASHNSTNGFNDLSTTDATATTLSTYENELTRMKRWLIANGWVRGAEFFAWPQGKFDATHLAIARKYFSLIRTYRTSLSVPDADTYPFVDVGRLRQIAVVSGASPTAAATVTAALTAAWAAKKTVVLTFHGLGSVQGYEYPVASFQTIVDHIATSGFPVKTLSETVKDGGIDSPINKGQLDTKATIPTGTPTGAKFFRDDYVWATPGGAAVASDTHAASSKATPVDADELPLVDSEASFGLKKFTWANLKTALALAINPGGPYASQSGFLGWTSDPIYGMTANFAQTLGITSVVRIIADQSGTCANLGLYLGVLASGMTSNTFQLFNSAGAEIANTGDVKATLTTPNTTGGKSIPWITPVAVTAGSTYYVGWTPIGGTAPQLGRGAVSPSTVGTGIVPATRYGQVTGTVTSPPASITPGSLVAATTCFWFTLKT